MTTEPKHNPALSAESAHSGLQHCIFIKEHTHLIRVNYHEILYLCSSHVYVNIVTHNKEYIVRSSLADYLTRMDPEVFMRVHRSHAVNLHHITKITPSSVWLGNKELSLAAPYRDALLNRIRY